MYDSALDAPFRDLTETLDDFERAPYQNAANILGRFVAVLSSEPLAGFLRAALPSVDYDGWIKSTMESRGGMAGSGRLEWPTDRGERVALQAALIKDLAINGSKLLGFAREFCYSGSNSISSHFQRFADLILRPFLRDLERLTENRIVPPVLFDAMGTLPTSGDAVLDQLIKDAITKFKDSAPASRKEGLERLWDAWERIKSLEVEGNKRLSVSALLDRAAPTEPFRNLLEQEARALTEIGNTFHIRHFEANRSPIEQDSHIDYLFHRLFALLHLVIYARAS
jgi:hypothetical protein